MLSQSKKKLKLKCGEATIRRFDKILSLASQKITNNDLEAKKGETKKKWKVHDAVIYPHNFILSHCNALQCLSFKFWPNEKIEILEKVEQLKKKKIESEGCSALIFDPAYSTQILLEGCTHRNYSGCHSQLLLFTLECVVLDSSNNNFWVAIVMMTEV